MAEAFKWSKQKELDPDQFTLREIEGGPQEKTGWRSKRSLYAAVLLADPSLYRAAVGYTDRGLLAQDAILCVTDRGVLLGKRPETGRVFGAMQVGGERWPAAAFELGETSVKIAMGLWVPSESEFHQTGQEVAIAARVHIDCIKGPDASRNYMHVPLLPEPR